MRRLPRAVFPPPELDCGTDLTRHLQGCDAVLLMAATLGSQVDSLLRRLELTDIAMAAAAVPCPRFCWSRSAMNWKLNGVPNLPPSIST